MLLWGHSTDRHAQHCKLESRERFLVSARETDTDGFGMKLANSSSIDAPADEVSHRQTTCCGNPSLSSGPSGKPPPPPPFPPQTSSSQNKFDVSAPRKIPNHVTPLLRAVFKRCRHYYFEGKISDTPVLDENCILRYINVDTEFQRGPTWVFTWY